MLQPQQIDGMTRDIGKPSNWDDRVHGACGSLPVRDTVQELVPYMVSEWKPSPEDLAKLNAGESLFLGIAGSVHPVVYLDVGDRTNAVVSC